MFTLLIQPTLGMGCHCFIFCQQVLSIMVGTCLLYCPSYGSTIGSRKLNALLPRVTLFFFYSEGLILSPNTHPHLGQTVGGKMP